MTVAVQASLDLDSVRLRVLDAVRQLAARPFTAADVVAQTGLPPYEVEHALSAVIRDYRSDIDVDEAGNLLYRVDPALSARPDIVKEDAARRRKAKFKLFLIAFFKAWTITMLIAYFVIYVILLIALVVASSANNKNSRGGSSMFRLLGELFVRGVWFGTSGRGGYGGWRNARHRREAARDLEDTLQAGRDPYRMDEVIPLAKPSFTERVWFHLFGPEGLQRTPLEAEKELLTYIRAKRGLIVNADIMALLGVTYAEADSIGTRLVATYEGELDLTDEGVAIYRFPNLMLRGAPEVALQQPTLDYYWQARRREENLRQHPPKAVPWLNAFNIIMALVTWSVILPMFDWHGPFYFFTLVAFPLVFSIIFATLEIRQALRNRASAAARRHEAIRVAALHILLTQNRALRVPKDVASMVGLGLGKFEIDDVLEALPTLAPELRGKVSGLTPTLGTLEAPDLIAEVAAVERLRLHTTSSKAVGRTVFSTALGPGDVPVVPDRTAAADPLAAEIAALDAHETPPS